MVQESVKHFPNTTSENSLKLLLEVIFSKNIRYILILLFISVPLFKIASAEYIERKYTDKSLPRGIRNQLASDRDRRENVGEVFKILKIKPGMTILDIGTGLGYFAYKFAEELKGTGRAILQVAHFIKDYGNQRGN